MTEVTVEPGSFRDRQGRIFYSEDRIFRALGKKGWRDWKLLCSTNFFNRYSAQRKIVPTCEVGDFDLQQLEGNWVGALEHERIPFVSYPYEWCFSMLKDAGLLHIDLILSALEENMILKDATSYNIQWVGTQVMFIDTGSFAEYKKGEPWKGYRQFSQLFLYPLMIQCYKGLPFQPLLRGRLEGIHPADCNSIMSSRDLFRSGVFSHVYLQNKLGKRYGSIPIDVKKSLRKAGFRKKLITANLRKIRKLITCLDWSPTVSTWSEYASDNSYSNSDEHLKREFVEIVTRSRSRTLVWDLGCNTGIYSRIAASNSDCVIAMDSDQLAIDRFYQKLKEEKEKRILPLVNDLSDPSPRWGWNYLERKNLSDRGKPDLILALALIHHVVISANIPLPDFIKWLAQNSCELVLEFVDKSDSMVAELLRNKDDQYVDYEKGFLEKNLKKFYRIQSQQNLKSGMRTLYYCVPR